MKKFSFLIALAAAIFTLGGCKKKGSLDLVFEAKMNGQNIVAGQRYDFLPAKPLNFEKVAGFFTVVALVKSDGSEVALGDFDYLDLTNGAQTLAVDGLDASDFSGIKIGFGLPASLNSTNPNSLKSSDPRTVNGREEWWSDWKSYIFTKVQGRFDSDGDGQLETGFAYHCGSNAVYREIVFEKNFAVAEDESTELGFVFELSDFLKEAGQPFDIVQKPLTSDDPDDISIASVLVENWAAAVKLK